MLWKEVKNWKIYKNFTFPRILVVDGEREGGFERNIRDGLEGEKEDGGCCESFGEHLDR